jgi:ASC-1-like (ASCH) protein
VGTNNTMDTINVQEPYFGYIASGKKTVEGRICKVIKIACDNRFIVAYIKDVRKYDSFKDYLSSEGLSCTLPNVGNLEDGCNVYYQFYTREQEREYGIVALDLCVIV